MKSDIKKNILLVEDEVIIAMGKQMELEKYGYNIILADTGEKAVSMVKENNQINLILMDIDLGSGIDGTKAAELILRDREIPVVFLSSHMEPEIVEKTEKITSYGYVVKSSSITVLDASIKMAFKLFNANMKIEESDKKQKTMLSNITDVIGIMDADGNMKYKSPNIEKWFGWGAEELVGTDGFQNVHPDDIEKTREVFTSLLQNDIKTKTIELRYKCKNGNYKPIELTAVNLIEDPVINGILLNYRDISQRLLDEERIREKDLQFRKLSANVPDMIFQFTRDLDGKYYVPIASQGIKNVFGCTPEDVADNFEPISRVLHPDDAERVIREIEYSANHLSYFNCEFRVVIPGRPVQWLYARSAPEKQADGRITWYGFNANITEIKQTEEALRKNEEYLRVTLQSIGDAVITTDTGGLITNMNHVAEKLTGWKLETASGMPFSDVFKIIDSETREAMENPVALALKTGLAVGLANHTMLISKDRKEYQIADSASPIKDSNGKVLGVVLVFRDVTEEYRIKQELKRNEEQYRMLFESTIEGICLHEIVYDDSEKAVDYRILDANSRFEQILGLKKADVIGKPATEVYHTEEAPYLDIYKKVAETGIIEKFEVYFPPMDKYFLISVFSPAKFKFATIFEDITNNKLIKQVENKTTANLHSLINNRKESIWSIDTDYKYIILNDFYRQTYSDIYGVQLKKGMNALKALPPAQVELWKSRYDSALAGNAIIFEFENPINHSYEIYLNPIITDDEVTGVTALSIDITEKRRLETALNDSIKDLKETQRIAHVGSWHLNLSTNEVYWSEELYRIYGLDPSNPAPPYTEHGKIFTPDSWSILSESLAKTAETGIPYELELETLSADGTNGWLWVHGEAEKDEKGKITGLHGAARDITESKMAEQEINRQLNEKEIILKDSHHRIKNNFATIASLLTLQADSSDNPEVKSGLNVAIGRVNGMRLLYEKLLLTDNYRSLSVKNYINNLIDEIISLNSNNLNLEIKRHIEDVPIDSQQLFPFGLIVNELMTNILKYAFTDRKAGSIEISLKECNGEVFLMLQDDGNGLPDDFDIDNNSGFGLTLIKMLSKQLGGNFSIEDRNGTLSTLKIPVA